MSSVETQNKASSLFRTNSSPLNKKKSCAKKSTDKNQHAQTFDSSCLSNIDKNKNVNNLNEKSRSEQIQKLSDSAMLSSIQLYKAQNNNAADGRQQTPPTVQHLRSLNNSKSLNILFLCESEQSTADLSAALSTQNSPTIFLSNEVDSVLRLSPHSSMERVDQLLRSNMLNYSSSLCASNSNFNRCKANISNELEDRLRSCAQTPSATIENDHDTVCENLSDNSQVVTKNSNPNNTNSSREVIKKKANRKFGFQWIGKKSKRRKINKIPHQLNNVSDGKATKSDLDSADKNSTQNSKSSKKKTSKIDWTDTAKQGAHIWYETSNLDLNEACYLNNPDNIAFHGLNESFKCKYSSNNIPIKQHALDSSAARAQNNSTSHHWICKRYDEKSLLNNNGGSSRCQACLRSYSSRFALPTNRITVIECTWCKVTYHFKCFSSSLFKLECSLGDFNQLIVPPDWIVKTSSSKNAFRSSHLTRLSSNRSSKRRHSINEESENKTQKPAFILRPNLPTLSPVFPSNIFKYHKPLLVLINPKSGGKIGAKLFRKFCWLLNPRQVFDLTAHDGPSTPLHLYRNVPNLRLLVCGGDGSVGWVLSALDEIKFLSNAPPVGVLPLGTGNDLARVLNWGGSFNSDESLKKILAKVLESRTVKLDRWKITVRPNADKRLNPYENSENYATSFKIDVMNNYFSLGADAHVCLEFHEAREANHQKYSSRWFNLLQYVEVGGKDIIKQTWKDLADYVQLECDSKDYTDHIKSRAYHCIIFLNIAKYGAGTNPWGSALDTHFANQSMNDGRLEVIGCYTSTLTKLQIGGAGERICQAKSIKLTTFAYIPMQIDGEPSKLCPSVIEISHKNQASMLEHVKFNTDSPLLSYHNSSVHKKFQVKCVLMQDYAQHRHDFRMLEKSAIHIGAICTSNFNDQLLKVKLTINMLIKNCANGFFTDKWSFLNGDEFYRLRDDDDSTDDTCLLDLVSSKDETVYILDENEANTTINRQSLRKSDSVL